MEKCPACGKSCNFKAGDIAVHHVTETRSRFPVSDTFSRYVVVVGTKCLFGYKDNYPVVKGHDYICKKHPSDKETFPVTGDRLKKVIDPNNILKEVLITEAVMSAKENFQEFKKTINKNAIKNKIKEKKRLEKERKKNVPQENTENK